MALELAAFMLFGTNAYTWLEVTIIRHTAGSLLHAAFTAAAALGSIGAVAGLEAGAELGAGGESGKVAQPAVTKISVVQINVFMFFLWLVAASGRKPADAAEAKQDQRRSGQ